MLRAGSSGLDMEGREGTAQWPEYRTGWKEAASQNRETRDYRSSVHCHHGGKLSRQESAAKAEGLSSIPRTHVMEGENRLPQVDL